MHSRNIYGEQPTDFAKLGEKYAEFRKHLIPTKSDGFTINFKDPRAVRELTVCLLHNDFDLKVELPLERLIPTVPQKLNYILWIEDLLLMVPSSCPVSTEKTKGIDIGTGASCIYPLLGAKMNDWMFRASEVDDFSFYHACENVARNNLGQNIHVQLVSPDTILKPLLEDGKMYDFCMCNPPFFAKQSETTGQHSRTETRPQPSSVCTGSVTETVTQGGEVEFVGRIIEDSLELGTKIKWYTTMLGKKSSVSAVVAKLKKNNIHKIVTTEFCQGRTMRWGVAWTYLPDVMIETPPKKKRKVKPLEFTFFPKIFSVDEFSDNELNQEDLVSRISIHIRKMLVDLQVNIVSEVKENTNHSNARRMRCEAMANTWANQRRKRREAARKVKGKEGGISEATDVTIDPDAGSESNTVVVAHVTNNANVLGGDVRKDDVRNDVVMNDDIRNNDAISNDVSRVVSTIDKSGGPTHYDVKTNDVSGDVTSDVTTSNAVSQPRLLEYTEKDKGQQGNTKLLSDACDSSESAKCVKAVPIMVETDPLSQNILPRKATKKRAHDSLEFSPGMKDDKSFLEFIVEVGVKHAEVVQGMVPNVFLRMTWISGNDRNSLYQLFQYFQNRLIH